MKTYLKIDDFDLSKWILRGGLKFSNIERRASSFVTLDGTDHSAALILRGITVTCGDMSESTCEEIYSRLQNKYVSVSYVDPARGEVEDAYFKVTAASIAAKVVEGNRTFYSGLSFTLEERGAS